MEWRMINERHFRIANQHVIDARIELTVYDSDFNVIDVIEGVLGGGSLNLDTGSAIRRSASFTIQPSRQIQDISESSLIWLDKVVQVRIGIKDSFFNYEYEWYKQGLYRYTSANTTYDATTNTLSIELSDLASLLDGSINGQVGGALTTVYQAYDEDPDTGEPISYNTIKGAIEKTLESAGLHAYDNAVILPWYDVTFNSYVVEDIGEYYAMPQYNDNYEQYRSQHPLWNMIPYDLEFSTGATVWEMITELVELYPNYDAAYDSEGIFRVQMIPSEYKDEYDFRFEDFKDLVISENRSVDLSTIRNVCEVWGETMDADRYSESTGFSDVEVYNITFVLQDKELTIEKKIGSSVPDAQIVDSYDKSILSYNFTETWKDFEINFQNNILTITSTYNTLHGLDADYPAGAVIYQVDLTPQPTVESETPVETPSETPSDEPSVGDAPESPSVGPPPEPPFTISLYKPTGLTNVYTFVTAGYYDEYQTGTRFATKFTVDSVVGQLMRINDLEPVVVIDNITKAPIDANRFNIAEHPDRIHVFQVVKVHTQEDTYVTQIYYLGVSQSHAIDILTSGDLGPNVTWTDPVTQESFTFHRYSRDYYEKVLNCDNITMTVIPNSPFTVQKIGERIDVKEGGEFANITSDELAIERAQYENWKNSRLTDTIDLTTKLMPFVEPYMKIDYKRHGSITKNDYIIKSVSHDLDNGTTTINMYTFYPLYKAQPGDAYRMTYDYMSGFQNDDLYGDQDAQATESEGE